MVAKIWMHRFNSFSEFVKEHKRYPSARSPEIKEKSLGIWTQTQRMNNNSGILSEERLRLLAGIGYDFSDQRKERHFSEWMKTYERFKQYLEEY